LQQEHDKQDRKKTVYHTGQQKRPREAFRDENLIHEHGENRGLPEHASADNVAVRREVLANTPVTQTERKRQRQEHGSIGRVGMGHTQPIAKRIFTEEKEYGDHAIPDSLAGKDGAPQARVGWRIGFHHDRVSSGGSV
jgi:hypothetical protein